LAFGFIKRIVSSPFNPVALCSHNIILGGEQYCVNTYD
jgi:hypothetical protein